LPTIREVSRSGSTRNAECGYLYECYNVQFSALRMTTVLALFPRIIRAEEGGVPPKLTHRLLLELPQPENQQQNVKEKQRNQYSYYR
jgi:hypothetical protein